jgi:hypothetical protein
MTEINTKLRSRLVVSHKRDGRCVYDRQAKQEQAQESQFSNAINTVALRSSGTAFEEVRIESESVIPIRKTGAAPSSCVKSSAT